MELGGSHARFICKAFSSSLSLRYFGTAQSGRLAQAFQFAASQALHDRLVCLSAATLLNPEALASYAQTSEPGRIQFGYIGCGRRGFEPDGEEAAAFSLWFAHAQVAFLDRRFLAFRRDGVLASPYVLAYPFLDAGPSNFALSRQLLMRLGGFNATLGNWQHACQELAMRAANAGCGFDFRLAAWAEQLPGERPAEPPGLDFRPPASLVRVRIPTRVLDQDTAARRLLAHLFQDYCPQMSPTPGSLPHSARPERAVLLNDPDSMLVHRPHSRQPGYQLARYQPGQLPAFLIIGTQKGGTTSLFHYLGQHPGLSPALLKEVHFFDRDENFQQGKAWYAGQFLGEAGQLGFEATPEYLDGEECAARIVGTLPGVKLIVLLRDPIERAFSAWNMYRHQLPSSLYYEPRSFETLIAQELEGLAYRGYLERGKYVLHLRRFLKYFKASQLLLLDFDELHTQPQRLLQRCCDFLSLPAHLPLGEAQPFNQGQYNDALPEALRSRLKDYFTPYNQRLKQEWNLDFAWLGR